MTYFFSTILATFLTLTVNRLQRGLGGVLLLEGPPGGGKTSFAKALAQSLGGTCHYYSGSPDKERDLLYDIDVQGVLKKENAWVPGPAWEAFEATQRGEFAVLLIDEVDKTNPGFDAFLLRLLEEFTFKAPDGEEISADPSKLAVVLTSNGRRKLPSEVLRRTQRIYVPLPSNKRLKKIIREIAQVEFSEQALDLAIRIGQKIGLADEENQPSPKELAMALVDLTSLRESGVEDIAIWREVAASWLVKKGGAEAIDRAVKFKWAKALRKEVFHEELGVPRLGDLGIPGGDQEHLRPCSRP